MNFYVAPVKQYLYNPIVHINLQIGSHEFWILYRGKCTFSPWKPIVEHLIVLDSVTMC